jgi:putative oxidoreductase
MENEMATHNIAVSPSNDTAKLVLRVALAVLLLFHGISKVIGGVGFVTGALTKMGLPAAFGYLVYIGEVVAPLMILLGIWTRAAALVVVINMIVAILLVHTMSPTGGWPWNYKGCTSSLLLSSQCRAPADIALVA